MAHHASPLPAQPVPAKARRIRADGARARELILDTAARLATVEGLDGLSIGALAEATGMSKSGLYAHFGSKEELQLATIAKAQDIFMRTVVGPALNAPDGVTQLRTLCEAFLRYVEDRVFPGGCFFASVAAEVNAKPGPVRDVVAEQQRQWMALLRRLVRQAQQQNALPPNLDPVLLAFELNATLAAANTALLLQGDPAVLGLAREAIRQRIGGPTGGLSQPDGKSRRGPAHDSAGPA